MATGESVMMRPAPGAVVERVRADRAHGPGAVLYTSSSGRLKPGVTERLQRLCATVVVAPTLADALTGLAAQPAEACVVDLTADRTLPAAVRLLRSKHRSLPIVCLVDPAFPLVSAEAVQAGMPDVLPWPCEERELALALANVAERAPSHAGRRAPEDTADGSAPLFAQSAAMRDVLEQVRCVAATRGGVVVCGEPSTGRTFIARTIHRWSSAATAQPFVEFDCGGDDAQDVERRLFGTAPLRRSATHSAPSAVRVGPTGAVTAARGGTLFLKHVIDLPARVQSALARLLRDREAVVEPGSDVIDLDIRPIAALDPDVESAVADGRLQEDLFERLAQTRIDAAPLRRRRDDVPALAAWLLDEACRSAGLPTKVFSRSALSVLSALPWRGNVDELRALVDGVARTGGRTVVQVDDLLEHASLEGVSARLDVGVTLKDAKARFERECIAAVLRRHHGRVGEAAKALGIQRTNLYRKVRQLNVSRALLSTRR